MQLLRYIYYPLLLVITVGVTKLLSGWLPEIWYPAIPFLLFVIFLFIFIFGERYLPYRPEWNGIKEDTRSTLYER